MRECANALLRVAKDLSCCVLLVGHVTKTGDIAGPKTLEHIVDTVLYLEGEQQQSYRWGGRAGGRAGVFNYSDVAAEAGRIVLAHDSSDANFF